MRTFINLLVAIVVTAATVHSASLHIAEPVGILLRGVTHQVPTTPNYSDEDTSNVDSEWREDSIAADDDDTIGSGSLVGPGEDDGNTNEDEEGALGSPGNTQGIGPTPNQPTTTEATSSSPACFPGQICKGTDLLDTGGGAQSVSSMYRAALGAFNLERYKASVVTLLREANGEIKRACGKDFTELNDTVLNATQRAGPGEIYFIFPTTLQGAARQLNNAEVRFTIPNLGSYGAIQLRFLYDSAGVVSDVVNFIRPPRETEFFAFPIIQQVKYYYYYNCNSLLASQLQCKRYCTAVTSHLKHT